MTYAVRRSVCVCVPARDEVERLPRLLAALARQIGLSAPLQVVIAINNSTDGSADAVERFVRDDPGALAVRLDETTFAPAEAHAGTARRRAMNLGLDVLRRDDRAVLLTTDADARPPQDWVVNNVAAIERGVDLVGGALVLDEEERGSPVVRARWEALAAYWRAVRAVEDEIDPVAWDPPPRHGDHTGGSLAATVAAYRAAGGVPALASGEDAAFVMTARAKGFRLAHPADVWTRVSPRTVARAHGGMATMLGALERGDPAAMTVPSLDAWRERALWRRSVRMSGGDAQVASLEPTLSSMPCDAVVAASPQKAVA